jgi:hypothetical protein
MKITIDEKKCLKYKLTFKEFLAALTIKNLKDPKSVIDTLVNRDVLDIKDDKYVVTDKWSETLDKILTESGGTEKTDEEFIEMAKKMRELYPEGKMLGTTYFYRCNNKEVANKLKRFFIQYGDKYTEQDILDATQRFVAAFKGNYKYLPLLKYFISKQKSVEDEDGVSHNIEYSPLADYLENPDSNENGYNDDWDSEVV